jgi:hypothetical protein
MSRELKVKHYVMLTFEHGESCQASYNYPDNVRNENDIYEYNKKFVEELEKFMVEFSEFYPKTTIVRR